MSFNRTLTPNVTATGVNVDFIRNDLAEIIAQYEKIRDCLAGQDAIIRAGIKYLPMPEPENRSEANLLRYEDYKLRAVFYGVTKRTQSGLIGQVFLIPPLVEVPTLLDPVLKDANGNGVPLIQLAQQAEEYVLAYGRAGLLADFPKTEGTVSRAEQLSGKIRPTITCYAPWNIINWRTITVGSQVLLSLVVIREKYEKKDDGFAIEYDEQYRVLRLVNGIYIQEIWRKNNTWTVFSSTTPTGANGELLTEIPFMFIGSVNNDSNIDPSPLYDLAELNLAHYRNSAAYEESIYITGQATLVLSGLTADWVKNVLKNEVRLGSRGAISLPVGGSAELLQMEANTAAFEAMEHKEKQMVALGAKLVEQCGVQRTATEANQEKASETSVLTTITNNVSAAFTWALEWCSIFAGATTVSADASSTKLKFKLNTEFTITSMTAEDVRFAIEAWQKEAITFKEMRAQLRKTGVATADDDEANRDISEAAMNDITGNETDENENNE